MAVHFLGPEGPVDRQARMDALSSSLGSGALSSAPGFKASRTSRGAHIMADGLAVRYSAIADDGSGSGKGAAVMFATAEEHLNKNEAEEALDAGRKAQEGFKTQGDKAGEADALRIVIKAQYLKGEPATALELAETELSTFKDSKDKRGQACMLLSLAELTKDSYGSAIRVAAVRSAEEAVALFKEVGDKKMTALALVTKSAGHLAVGSQDNLKSELKAAMALAKEAIDVAKGLGDKATEAKALQTLGSAFAYQKDYTMGIKYARDAVAIWKTLGDKREVALALYCISHWQFLNKSSAEALAAAEEAQTLFAELGVGSNYDVATLGLVIRGYLETSEDKDKPLEIVQGALDKLQASGNKRGAAAALCFMAEVQMARQEILNAYDSFGQAITVVRRLPQPTTEDQLFLAALLSKKAAAYMSASNVEEAAVRAEEAWQIIKDMGDEKEEPVAMLSLALIYFADAKLNDAMFFAKQARNIFREQENKSGEGIALIIMANVHLVRTQYKKAEVMAKQAQLLFVDDDSSVNEVQALYLVAETHYRAGDFDSAIKVGRQAQSLAQSLKDSQLTEYNIVTMIAQAALGKAGATAEPEKGAYAKALEIADEAKALGASMERNELVAQAAFIRAQNKIQLGETNLAMEALDEARTLAAGAGSKGLEGHVILLQAFMFAGLKKRNDANKAAQKAETIFKEVNDMSALGMVKKFLSDLLGPPKKKVKKEKKSKKSKKKKVVKKVKKSGGGGGPGQMMEVYKGPSSDEVAGTIQRSALDLIGSDELEADTPLMDAGLDSLASVEFQSILQKEFAGVNLPSTLMFDMPTTKMISDFIYADLKEKMTVTEMVGGGDEEEEEEEEEESESSEDEKPKKKKKKGKKEKSGGGGGGPGQMMEVYKGPSSDEVAGTIQRSALDLIGSDELEADTPLMDAGLDSLASVEFQSILQKEFAGVNLPSTLMFDMPTTKMISDFIYADLKEKMTVTEMVGGGGGGEGDDDSDSGDDDDSGSDDSDADSDEEEDDDDMVLAASGGGGGGGGALVPKYAGPSPEEVVNSVKGSALDLIGTDELESDTPLMDAGLDSLASVEFQSILQKEFAGVNLPSTLMFDMPSVKMISDYVYEQMSTNEAFFK